MADFNNNTTVNDSGNLTGNGASRGYVLCVIQHGRIAGTGKYIPAYRKPDGKEVQSKAIFNVYTNVPLGNGQLEKHSIDIEGWGKLADTLARSCSTGKEVSVIGRLKVFPKKMYNRDGSMRLDSAGQSLEYPRQTVAIQQITFASDGAKFVAGQISENKRPRHWNVPGHPEQQAWKKWLKDRGELNWDGSKTFEYSEVRMPKIGQVHAPGTAPYMKRGQSYGADDGQGGAAFFQGQGGSDFQNNVQNAANNPQEGMQDYSQNNQPKWTPPNQQNNSQTQTPANSGNFAPEPPAGQWKPNGNGENQDGFVA